MLTQANKDEISRRLIYLRSELNDSAFYTNVTWEIYQTDRRKRRELERWAENIVNCIIDISKVILEAKDLPLPETYRDTIKAMDSSGLFGENIGERLSRWARMRNVLAHEYLDIRWNIIKSFLQEVGELSEQFIKGAERFISG